MLVRKTQVLQQEKAPRCLTWTLLIHRILEDVGAPSPTRFHEQWAPRGCKILEVEVKARFNARQRGPMYKFSTELTKQAKTAMFPEQTRPRSRGRAPRPGGGVACIPFHFPLKKKKRTMFSCSGRQALTSLPLAVVDVRRMFSRT